MRRRCMTRARCWPPCTSGRGRGRTPSPGTPPRPTTPPWGSRPRCSTWAPWAPCPPCPTSPLGSSRHTSTMQVCFQCYIHTFIYISTTYYRISTTTIDNKDKLQFSNLLPFSGMSSLMSSGFAAMTPFSGQAYTQLTASAKWRKKYFHIRRKYFVNKRSCELVISNFLFV